MEWLFGVLGALGLGLWAAVRAWLKERTRRQEAERRAKVGRETREIHRDLQEMDDTSLAERISRRK